MGQGLAYRHIADVGQVRVQMVGDKVGQVELHRRRFPDNRVACMVEAGQNPGDVAGVGEQEKETVHPLDGWKREGNRMDGRGQI